MPVPRIADYSASQSHIISVQRRRRPRVPQCTWRLGSAAASWAPISTQRRKVRVTCVSALSLCPNDLLIRHRLLSKGFAVTCALQFLAAVFAIILTVSYRIENKRRDAKYGKPVLNATVDTTELADKVSGDLLFYCAVFMLVPVVGPELPLCAIMAPTGSDFAQCDWPCVYT